MKTNQLNYIKASISNVALLEIENLIDFCKYTEQHHIKEIFVLEKELKFGILSHQLLLTTPSLGYQNLDDARKAVLNNFPSSEDFYQALKEGIHTYEIFEMQTKHGINDKELLQKLHDEDYLTGFENYKMDFEKFQKANPNVAKFQNAYELYQHTNENKFDDFNQLLAAFAGGFSSSSEYKDASLKGYENKTEYDIAMTNGFPNKEYYEKAKAVNVATYNEYILKNNLEVSYPELTHDKSLLLFLISKIEQGKKASINKLQALLGGELNMYKSADGKLFNWFTTSLSNTNDFIDFIEKAPEVTNFGSYDSDGEFLEIFQLKNRSVVIDGSNIAHNSNAATKTKPSIANLLTMVRFLKSKGFSEILIIADASLRHKLCDLNKIDQLHQEAKYLIAPAGVTADVYLLDHVKQKHCLLVSNDTFKDYKLTDPWVALHVDSYRLTFMITDDGVFMPDL